MTLLRRVPAWVWLLLLPAVGIALNEVRKGGRERVEVVGAGPVARVAPTDAPPAARLYFDTVRSEAPKTTVARIRQTLRLHPPIVVWGLDFSDGVPDRELLLTLSKSSNAAATVTVMLGPGGPGDLGGPEMDALVDWWRASICRAYDRFVCVDLSRYRARPEAVGPAVSGAIADGLDLLGGLRAATQVRR